MAQTVLPPGFRFHPTDQELVVQYLKRKAIGQKFAEGVIGELEIYKYEPWELPVNAILDTNDQEWYFFSLTDKKYPQGSRTSRTTARGYWKATGKDRKIYSGAACVGMKKTLVFYTGRVPNGKWTEWIMHEYRLDEKVEKSISNSRAFVLCKVRKKGEAVPRNGEHLGALALDQSGEAEGSTNCAMLLPELSESLAIHEVGDVPGEADKVAEDFSEVKCLPSGDELEVALNSLLSHDKSMYEASDGFVNVPQNLLGEGSGDIFTLDFVETLNIGQHVGIPGSSSGLQGNVMEAFHDLVHPTLEEQAMQELLVAIPGSGSGLQGNVIEAFHDLVHPSLEEQEMLKQLLYDSTGTQQDGRNFPVQSLDPQSLHQMNDGFLDDFLEMNDLEVPINELFLPWPSEFDEGEEGSFGTEVNSWLQHRTPSIFDPGEHPQNVSHRVRLQVPVPSAVGHDGAGNVENQEANVYLHGESPYAMEVPMLMSGDRNFLDFQNVLGRKIKDGAMSSDALSGFGCASAGELVNTCSSLRTSSGTLTYEQLPAQIFKAVFLGGVNWQEGKLGEGEGSVSVGEAGATGHMSLGKGDDCWKNCSIGETCVCEDEDNIGNAKGPVVLAEETDSLFCATVPPIAQSPKFLSQLVLGVLGKVPAKPAFAVELPEDTRLLSAVCESRGAQATEGYNLGLAQKLPLTSSSTSLFWRLKSPIASELHSYLKGCTDGEVSSGLSSNNCKLVPTIGSGCGIRIFFRVVTSLLIFACLSRGLCRLTRIILTVY